MSFKKLVIVLAFISAGLSMWVQSAESNYLHIYTNGQWFSTSTRLTVSSSKATT